MASKNGASLLKAVITLSDLATLTVQSERNVQRLVKSGVIRLARDRHGRQLKGRFVLGECVPAFCEHLREVATADPHESSYAEARSRRMQASAESEEMDLRLKKGELMEKKHILFLMTGVILSTRNRLLSLPSRITRRLLPHVVSEDANASFQSVYQITNGEVRAALTEVSRLRMDELFNRKEAAAHHGASIEEIAEMERNGENED
jgi:phage terminase Nu1 subunit (DNA packaging protein)